MNRDYMIILEKEMINMDKDMKLKLGDILTYQISNKNVVETKVQGWDGLSIKKFENKYPYKVLKVERQQTIYKFKEILDEKEKEYLSAVIRPFKSRIKSISKHSLDNEYICIELSDFSGHSTDCIMLPLFKTGTMYKGMHRGKEYTLKELGLD